jgi:CBS domain-containing protein
MTGYWITLGGIVAIALAVLFVTRGAARDRVEQRRLDRALMTKARDVMSRPLVVARETTTVADAAALMVARGIGTLPVVDAEGHLTGIVTETDLSAARLVASAPALVAAGGGAPDTLEDVYTDVQTRPLAEIMSRPVLTADEDEPAADLALRMLWQDVRRLPIVQEGVPVGIVTEHDLLKLFSLG